MRLRILFTGLLLSLVFVPHLAGAVDVVDCANLRANNRVSQEFTDRWCKENGRNAIEVVVETIGNWLVTILTIFASIIVIIGAIEISASGGSPGAIKDGKKKIAQAVGGVATLWVARLFLDLIGATGQRKFLGVSTDDFNYDTARLILIAVGSYLMYTIGFVSVAMVIVGGIRLMTSQGNPNGVASAKKTILYAILGLVIAIILGNFFYLGNFVQQILTT